MRKVISGMTEMLAALNDGTTSPDNGQPPKLQRQIAALQRFDVEPVNGLNRLDASRAFAENGISPRAAGSWSQVRLYRP